MEIIASLGSLAIGVVILYIIVKLLALPFKLVWNGIIGAVMLWLANLLGGALFNVTIHITIIKALIAGFFGIPGAAAIRKNIVTAQTENDYLLVVEQLLSQEK